MDVRVLGPVEAVDGDRTIAIASRYQARAACPARSRGGPGRGDVAHLRRSVGRWGPTPTRATSAALVVFGVLPGTTWDGLLKDATSGRKASDIPAYVMQGTAMNVMPPSGSGLFAILKEKAHEAVGGYAVGCASDPEPATGGDVMVMGAWIDIAGT